MGLSICEFFINLGIKGEQKTLGALADTNKGMTGLKSLSVETKAALIGVFYGVEQLISASAKYGQGLVNTNAVLDISIQKLQQFEYAGRQVGASGEEIRGTFMSIQGAMTRMLMGEGPPKGLQLIAQATKSFDVNRVRDTAYVFSQLQQAAQKLPKDLGNQALASFGLSPTMIAAMRRNAFREDVFAKAPVYGEKQAVALDHLQAQLSNLGQSLERAFGNFAVKHGAQLIGDIGKIATAVIHLADSLTTLSQKAGVFTVMAEAAESVSNTIKLLTELIDKLGGKDSKKGDLLYQAPGAEAVPGWENSPARKFLSNVVGMLGSAFQGTAEQGLRSQPPVKPIPLPYFGAQNIKTQHGTDKKVEVNQNLHFNHDGKDASRTQGDVKKAVTDAFRQMSAQGQGT